MLSYYDYRPDMHPQYAPAPYPRLPGEGQDAKRPAYVIWFVINPFSQKTEEALECIRWLAGPEADKYRGALLYRDARAYTNRDCTQSQLDAIGENLSHVDAVFSFPGFGEVYAPCSRYANGETDSLDEAIAEAQRILDTIQKEQYIGE